MTEGKIKPKDLSSAGRENALLRATLENMAQGVAMYDADHKLVTWNELFRQYLEMPDEFLGTDRTFSDYIRYIGARGEFGEDADIEDALQKRLAMLDRSHSFERVRPDGTVLEVRRDPVPGGGFIAIYTDITKRKRAENQLREDEERFRAIDNAAPVGLIIVSGKDQTLLHLNPSFCEITGKDATALMGKPAAAILDDAEKGRELAGIIAAGSGERREFHFVRPDGAEACAMVSCMGLEYRGEKAIIASFVDIHERVRAERELLQAKETAESANRVKSSFLANMSHELRTPLNAIIGYSEILAEEAADRGDKPSLADLEKIKAAGKHLLGLINDILDLSKIEAGRMDVYFEHVFLTRLVDEVKTIVAPMMATNGNTLAIDCPADIGSLQTDLTKLKQSIINLLSNAAKFTKNGTVTLRLARERRNDDDEGIKFEVIDTGIGMNEEQMGRLFQAFTQADASTTRNFGGTGLGLTITKHFCAMLGGSIDVKSNPGHGSIFTIWLPDRATQAPTLGDAASEAAAAIPERAPGVTDILIVDDDPAVHEVLAATLDKNNYQLRHARDGIEALTIMRAQPPDIVTLDVMMPKMDGWSVLGVMKSEPQLAHIPVIMLTIVDNKNLGFSLGAAEYMTKPIDRNRLIALVRKFAATRKDGVVLIVDDDADVRAMVTATVEDAGMQAAEAPGGQAALDWLAANPKPALVLLDLMMPKMDGFAFLEHLQQHPELADLPVVILTAKELTDNERSFLAERTLLVLTKGAQPISKLGYALAAIANRSRKPRHQGAADGKME